MRRFNKLLPNTIFSALLMGCISAAHAAPGTMDVEYDGYKYTIGSAYTSYTDMPSLLESQYWWGNQSLSFALSGLITDQLPGAPFLLFGYGLNNGYVSIDYYQGSVINCPTSCPRVDDPYSYATATRTALSPVTPEIPETPEAPEAPLPPEVIEKEMITLASSVDSLISASSGINSVTSNVNVLINGAHSRPIARLVEPGKNTFWIGGDWGHDDHGERDGSNGVAEFGLGRNFGFAQINVSIGQTWAKQNLAYSGDIDADGQYVMLEAIIPVSEQHSVYATFGGFGHWGESEIRRGYIYGDALDSSRGKADTDTWGARARLDWVNALTLHKTGISPYVDFSYTNARVDGYIEKSGNAPARFDSQTDRYTEARLGFNTKTPLPIPGFDFVTNLEGAHRFEDRTAGVSGDVTGLFTFKVKGEEVTNDWVKAGAGVEGLVGPGTVSFMLNGTSRSDMPNLWIAASYQLAF
ncbi:autotransporter outer membrane beta-barrel domain-containing protein [Stutzerimonas sp. VN223-3]|uniref:autotransporter outer membrane beta-barrel domain-containing protein n=1 Tax=Stutzerimonas sp. VN223-3 TaxID=3384601 RepID=UPI0038B56EBA